MPAHQKRQSLRDSALPAWPMAAPTNAWVKRLAIYGLWIVQDRRLPSYRPLSFTIAAGKPLPIATSIIVARCPVIR